MKKDLWFIIPFCATGVWDSLSDHNDNRCYTDASISNRLRLQDLQLVCNLFTFIFLSAQWDRYHFRNCQNPQMSSLVFARAKQTDATSATLNRIEVTIHTAFEQHPTARKTDDYPNDTSTNEKGSESPTGPTSDEDSFTIISANKHMSCIVGDSSKLFPSQASTHPLSTASPFQQAQSV